MKSLWIALLVVALAFTFTDTAFARGFVKFRFRISIPIPGTGRCPDGYVGVGHDKCCPEDSPYSHQGMCYSRPVPEDYDRDGCYMRFVNQAPIRNTCWWLIRSGDSTTIHWRFVSAGSCVWIRITCGEKIWYMGESDDNLEAKWGCLGNPADCAKKLSGSLGPDWTTKLRNFILEPGSADSCGDVSTITIQE